VHRVNLLNKLSKLSLERQSRKISITDHHKTFLNKLEASLQKNMARNDDQEVPLSPEPITSPDASSNASSRNSFTVVREPSIGARDSPPPRRQSSIQAPVAIKGTILGQCNSEALSGSVDTNILLQLPKTTSSIRNYLRNNY
jgi:hypothetical protein